MRLLRAYLRSLDPRLPRVVWTLQAGGLANAFGIGVVMPFSLIYFHNVRGISLTIAGLASAAHALVSIPAGTVGGALTDRFGAKRIVVVSLLVQAAAISCFPFIREGWHAIALEGALGLGAGAFWPSESSLLVRLTPDDRRHAALAQQRATMNLGIGLGGLAGGAIAVTSEPSTFTVLFAIDAVTFLAFALVLTGVPSPAPRPEEGPPGRYGDAFADRALVALLLLNTTFVAAGIVPLVDFLPVYAKSVAGVSEHAIGLMFFTNTMVIVLLQLPVSRACEGRRRMPALALMGAIWAATWLVVPVAVETLAPTPAALVLAVAAGLLGFGECMIGAVHGPLVADLAAPPLLGRYMALSSLSWQLAFVIGPAVGGAVLDAHRVWLWLGASAVCAAGAAWSLALERTIPERLRRTPGGGAVFEPDLRRETG